MSSTDMNMDDSFLQPIKEEESNNIELKKEKDSEEQISVSEVNSVCGTEFPTESDPISLCNIPEPAVTNRPVRVKREKPTTFSDSAFSTLMGGGRRAGGRLRTGGRLRGNMAVGTPSESTRSIGKQGRSRRALMRGIPMKAAPSFATVYPKDWFFYKEQYFQIGDIVSLVDINGDVYYAQIRALLQDQYAEKSCIITWLLPTLSSPSDGRFDPTSYVLGPDEEIPRLMAAVQFICHCPSDYYQLLDAPYTVRRNAAMNIDTMPQLGFLATRLGAHDVVFAASAQENLYQLQGQSTSSASTAHVTDDDSTLSRAIQEKSNAAS